MQLGPGFFGHPMVKIKFPDLKQLGGNIFQTSKIPDSFRQALDRPDLQRVHFVKQA